MNIVISTNKNSPFQNVIILLLQIGTWSRWLEDQFEQREDKSGRNKDEDNNNKEKPECEHFRLFHLLNSLGDLMMLPFKMLADKSTRKEVRNSTQNLFF